MQVNKYKAEESNLSKDFIYQKFSITHWGPSSIRDVLLNSGFFAPSTFVPSKNIAKQIAKILLLGKQ